MTDITFNSLGITSPSIVEGLAKHSFTSPTPIQAETIPFILNGDSCVGKAQTGTGKTAAFALPLLQLHHSDATRGTTLILTPTRELALQIKNHINMFDNQANVLCLYGGKSYQTQVPYIRSSNILVGTLGRVIDLIKQKHIKVHDIASIVLDEADQMFDMGFIQDVSYVLSLLKDDCQKLLFSATLSPQINALVKKYIPQHKSINIKGSTESSAQITQYYSIVKEKVRLEAIARFIKVYAVRSCIVFVPTKRDCVNASMYLKNSGIKSEFINGDLAQGQREHIINLFTKGIITCLVATDVVARGIDIKHVTHVINWSIPEQYDNYIHRIGRTGRYDKEGTSILFVSPTEERKLKGLMHHTRSTIKQLKVPTKEEIDELRLQSLLDSIEHYKQEENALSKNISAVKEKILEQYDVGLVIESLLSRLMKDDRAKDREDGILCTEFKHSSRSTEPRHSSRRRQVQIKIAGGKRQGVTVPKILYVLIKTCQCPKSVIGRISIGQNDSTVDIPSHYADNIQPTLTINGKRMSVMC